MTRSVVQLCPWASLLYEFVFFNREEGFVFWPALSVQFLDIWSFTFSWICVFIVRKVLFLKLRSLVYGLSSTEANFNFMKENCLKQQLETTFSSSSYRRSSLLCTLLTTVFYRMERWKWTGVLLVTHTLLSFVSYTVRLCVVNSAFCLHGVRSVIDSKVQVQKCSSFSIISILHNILHASSH